MTLYAIARPLPRGRTVVALIAGSSGFFKFDTYAHTGYLGISPTGYKASTVTVRVQAEIVQALAPAAAGDLTKRSQSLATFIESVSAVDFSQDGDTTEIIVEQAERHGMDFILFADISGR